MTNETPADAAGSRSPPIAISRIARFLEERYLPHVDCSDAAVVNNQDPRRSKLSRCLAAHAIAVHAETSAADAGASITDGFDDCGIDAVFHSHQQSMVYVVQSKWNDHGTKGLDEGEILKLCSGFRSVLNGEIETTNERLRSRVADLLPALCDPGTHFTIVVASTAATPLAPLQEKHLDDLIAECDGSGNVGLFHRETFSQKKIYDSLLKDLQPKSITLDVSLHEWGMVREPILSAYGQVELGDVLSWSDHGLSLFHKNLRNVVPKSDVRSSIFDTLNNAPDKFWYFNNGATLLCSSLAKAPLYGDKREKGTFSCDGVSVVNGAQTIGAIWQFAKEGGVLDPRSRMHIRLIQTSNCPPEFAADVTRATNTQQRIELKDFVALDPTQHRIAQEMALERRVYVFRSGDPVPSGELGCSFEEAATALACASGDVDLAVHASKEPSRLWADIDREPYTKLFPPNITVERIWRAVHVQRAVKGVLAAVAQGGSKINLMQKYGDLLTVFCVCQQSEIRKLLVGNEPLSELSESARQFGGKVFYRLFMLVEKEFPQDVIQTIFKNFTKCRRIAAELSVPLTTAGSDQRLFDPANPP